MIPAQYQNLSGFRTIYTETELKIAIAVAEVLIANALGSGGGEDDATASNQQIEIDAIEALNTAIGSPDANLSTYEDSNATLIGLLKFIQGVLGDDVPSFDVKPNIQTFLSSISSGLGSSYDYAAFSDIDQFSLISLFKRLLSIKLPSGLVNDRLKVDLGNSSNNLLYTTSVATASQHITGTVSASGDNSIISAPGANTYIYLADILIQNESAIATTIILKDSANRLRILAQNQGDGLSRVYPIGKEFKLAVNQPLILNLSGANSVGYSIGYYIGT